VIDGSNLATEGRKEPSLAQLDEAVRAIDAEYDFAQITVIVDATFEHRVAKTETKAARKAIDDNDILTPPAGVIGRGDAFILQVADRANAVVFSNDSFQEFHGTYDWLFDEGRLIGGKPVPGVGWIYVARSPVRGPVSRRATADSRKAEKAKKADKSETPEKPETAAKATSSAPAKKSGGRGRRRGRSTEAPADATPASEPEKKATGRGRRKATPSGDGSNDRAVWQTFKDDFPVGSTIAAHVDRFSSHGAYASVDDVVVYLPNRLLADPAPTKARDVIELGAITDFVIHRYDDERNGIDAGLIAAPGVPAPSRSTKKAAAKRAPAKKAAKKSTARKAPATKTTTKKTAAKKTAVKRTTATKAPAKRAAAKRTPAKKAAKKSTARKAPATKTTTKKTAAKKTTAKKATKKSATKKATRRS
jgi:hypothetical protein